MSGFHYDPRLSAFKPYMRKVKCNICLRLVLKRVFHEHKIVCEKQNEINWILSFTDELLEREPPMIRDDEDPHLCHNCGFLATDTDEFIAHISLRHGYTEGDKENLAPCRVSSLPLSKADVYKFVDYLIDRAALFLVRKTEELRKEMMEIVERAIVIKDETDDEEK